MGKVRLALGALLTQVSSAAVLELTSDASGSSSIEMRGARLQASCVQGQPSVLQISPRSLSVSIHSASVIATPITIDLLNVPTTCVGIPISQPCVELSKSVPRPPRFSCALLGAGGELMGGQTHAEAEEERTSLGELLGLVPIVRCNISAPLPTCAESLHLLATKQRSV